MHVTNIIGSHIATMTKDFRVTFSQLTSRQVYSFILVQFSPLFLNLLLILSPTQCYPISWVVTDERASATKARLARGAHVSRL